MKKLCVFCGSSGGHDSSFIDMAKELGATLAKQQIGLVYGGASIGLMGAVADSVLEGNGEVWGVMPKGLADREISHAGLTHLEIVDNMHVRKNRMYELSDGFIALPGGIGTLDELCEVYTWAQINLHQKPLYILNHNGFYDFFLKHIESVAAHGFMADEHLDLIKVESSVRALTAHFE